MKKEKKVSAAVLIIDPVTNDILVSHATGAPFKDKDGASVSGVWGLLKGEIDKGEEPDEAAIREVKEESGIKLKKKHLIYLGYQKYNAVKDLELFMYIDYKHIDHTKLVCDSYFENDEGKLLPENNGFAWINWPDEKHLLYKVQQNVLERVWPEVERILIEAAENKSIEHEEI